MIGPATLASADMPAGAVAAASDGAGDHAARLFSAAFSKAAVAVGGSDAALAAPQPAADVPPASSPSSASDHTISKGAPVPGDGDATAAVEVPAGDPVLSEAAPSAPSPGSAPAQGAPMAGIPARAFAPVRTPLPSRLAQTATPTMPSPDQAQGSKAVGAGAVDETPQGEPVASADVPRDAAALGLGRCDVDLPVKGKSVLVKVPPSGRPAEAEPAPAPKPVALATEQKSEGKTALDAQSDIPAKPKTPVPPSVPTIAASPVVETIAMEAAPATVGDPASVRPASPRAHSGRTVQPAGTVPGTLPDTASVLTPLGRDQVAPALAASIDIHKPAQADRREEAPSLLLAAAVAADPLTAGGDLAGPTMSQQMSAALVGGHNHQTEFAAHLEALADQVFVHGRDQHQARFTVDAAELGPVSVEVARRAEGVSVAFGTDNEAARAAIADAQPRLVADARLAGLTVSQSRVDTGGSRERRDGRQEANGTLSAVGRASVEEATVQSGSDRFA